MEEHAQRPAQNMEYTTIDRLYVGQTANMSKTISESDVYLFAGITGDLNPAHVNEAYAKGTRFHGRIAHGMLTAGLISAVIGTRLPGPGSIYCKQTLSFLAPVHLGDTVTAEATVERLEPKTNRVFLRTECRIQDGTLVTKGEAEILAPKAAKHEEGSGQ